MPPEDDDVVDNPLVNGEAPEEEEEDAEAEVLEEEPPAEDEEVAGAEVEAEEGDFVIPAIDAPIRQALEELYDDAERGIYLIIPREDERYLVNFIAPNIVEDNADHREQFMRAIYDAGFHNVEFRFYNVDNNVDQAIRRGYIENGNIAIEREVINGENVVELDIDMLAFEEEDDIGAEGGDNVPEEEVFVVEVVPEVEAARAQVAAVLGAAEVLAEVLRVAGEVERADDDPGVLGDDGGAGFGGFNHQYDGASR
ncbi:MAG: hypothetical protein RLN62_05500 [Rickettsiales bacterium]